MTGPAASPESGTAPVAVTLAIAPDEIATLDKAAFARRFQDILAACGGVEGLAAYLNKHHGAVRVWKRDTLTRVLGHAPRSGSPAYRHALVATVQKGLASGTLSPVGRAASADRCLIAKAMETTGLSTKKAVVEKALRCLIRLKQ
nr:type II toxin-antitoxin system VapB family antitoxin [Azospirillum brasilense]